MRLKNGARRRFWRKAAFGLLIAAALTLGNGARASEPTVTTPKFSSPAQSFHSSTLTGSGRRANVAATGLYQLPAAASGPILCLGVEIPRLAGDLVFARGVDDFYAGGNVLWTGSLKAQDSPGSAPPPAPQGLIDASGAFTAICRTERNAVFQHNYLKPCAPNWYFPKAFDIIGVRRDKNRNKIPNPIRIEVVTPAPKPNGRATLRIALNSNASRGRNNTLSVTLNGAPLSAKPITWKDAGYRVITLEFDSSLLKDGANAVDLLGDRAYIKHLDWVEISTPAQPRLRDGSLVVLAKSDAQIYIPNERYAIDITHFGAEKNLPHTPTKQPRRRLTSGTLAYFADHFKPLVFGPEIQLAEPKLKNINYVCVGLRDMLPALKPLLQKKKADRLRVACVALQDILNVYNGGLYGPDGLATMLNRFNPEYALLAGGFHRDCRARNPLHAADPDWNPGIPAEMRHIEQVTVSDDCYTATHTIKLGRVPARTKAELAAWAAKAARHKPSDNIALLAGKNEKANFSMNQKQHQAKAPSALVESQGRAPKAVRRELFDLMRDGARLVIYQGHAQSWEVDKGLLDKTHAAAIPESSWVLGTCNAAYYHADFDVYARDWMLAPQGGLVNFIGASSLGEANQQNQLIRRFLENLAKNPETDWGAMTLYLKKNLPLSEKMMNDPKLPASIARGIPRDKTTIDATCLLGDPAARVWAAPARKAIFQRPGKEPLNSLLPLGPNVLSLHLSGPWGKKTLARLALQWRVRDAKSWTPYPLASPFRPGANPFRFDTAALGLDGGLIELRVIERRAPLPETLWAAASARQENRAPATPNVMVRMPRSQECLVPAPITTDTLMAIACSQDLTIDRASVRTQFQIRDKTQPTPLFKDTIWLKLPCYSIDTGDAPKTLEIRVRQKKNGIESDWSKWIPFAPLKPRQPSKGRVR